MVAASAGSSATQRGGWKSAQRRTPIWSQRWKGAAVGGDQAVGGSRWLLIAMAARAPLFGSGPVRPKVYMAIRCCRGRV
jgi:hypothetical protein